MEEDQAGHRDRRSHRRPGGLTMPATPKPRRRARHVTTLAAPAAALLATPSRRRRPGRAKPVDAAHSRIPHSTFKETPMQPPNKFLALLQSRKFWTLVGSLLAVAASYSTGDINIWHSLIAAVTALSVYSLATGIEDGLSRRAG